LTFGELESRQFRPFAFLKMAAGGTASAPRRSSAYIFTSAPNLGGAKNEGAA
jgi:hypothetical protein